MVSKVFPKNHVNAGELTNFVYTLENLQKIHTIRPHFIKWAVRADEINNGDAYLSLRYWDSKPYHSKQIIIKEFTHLNVQPVTIFKRYDGRLDIMVGSKCKFVNTLDFVANDGLSQLNFTSWFFPDNKPAKHVFRGGIIHFSPFIYA